MTSTAQNKALVEEFFTRVDDGDLSVIDELCADEFAVEIGRRGTGESAIGTAGLKAIFEEYQAAFSDLQHEIDAMVAERDLVAVFSTASGTHQGEFRGVQPTGNDVAFEDTGLVRIEDGEIVNIRPLGDILGLFEQLGVGLDR